MNHNRFQTLCTTIALLVLLAGCQAPALDRMVARAGEWIQGASGALAGDEEGPLSASGTILADEIRIAGELGGRILEVRVTKGQEVRRGDVLVVLDAEALRDQLAEAEAAVAAAQADLAVVRSAPRAEQVAAARAALAQAEAQQAGAHQAWQNALDQLQNPQALDAQIVEARTQVDLAAQAAILAQAQLAREELLARQKREGTDERDAADLQVQASEQALAAAQADQAVAQTTLDELLAMRGTPLALGALAHGAEGQARVAAAGVAVAQARLDDLQDGATPQEVAMAEAAVRLAQAKADALRAAMSKCTLTSPVDGVVLQQDLYAGELAAPAATVLSLADLGQVRLTVYVPENQIGHVRLEQEAQVTVDSFPGRVFSGRVLHIGDEPEFTPRNVATQEERVNTFYAVEIQLPNADHALKPGMPADAVFD